MDYRKRHGVSVVIYRGSLLVDRWHNSGDLHRQVLFCSEICLEVSNQVRPLIIYMGGISPTKRAKESFPGVVDSISIM